MIISLYGKSKSTVTKKKNVDKITLTEIVFENSLTKYDKPNGSKPNGSESLNGSFVLDKANGSSTDSVII